MIDLCGSLRAQIAGRDVAALLPGRQGRALFAFLVLHRHRPVARHELLDVLWPVDPPDAPDAGLSTVLARVRRAVGEGVIEGRGELLLALAADADVDIERAAARGEQAERALADGDHAAAASAAQEALAIVGRPLLAGIDGAWIDSARAELAALEPGLLELLGRASLLAGDHEGLAAAERAARALCERHPFRESGYALLIEAQARLGNVAEATLTYDRVRSLLRDELGTVPSPGLAALHDQLLRSGRLAEDPAPVAAPAAPRDDVVPLPAIGAAAMSSPFVGREAQLERLRTLWAQACAGERRFELLMGEPGVGKTRLASHFAAEVYRGGATVLYGRCDEEPLLAYQPFVEALRHYLRFGDWEGDGDGAADLRQLARLLPEAGTPAGGGAEAFPEDPDGERYTLFEAVARLVDRATRRRPLLIVLDDLHWADKPTLLLLRHMLRLSGLSRLMLLGIFRDVEVDPDHPLVELIADMRRERRFERLALEGLDESETDALVAARLDATASAGFVRGLRAQTEGNPFFIEEALRSLVEARAVRSGAVASEQALESMGVPESVADVILRRLGRVSEAARDVLTAAAVIGREFDLRIVEALVDLPAERVLDAIEEAIAAGLVGEVAGAFDRFMFCHALVRDAIYDRIFTSRLLRLHLRVGEVLEADHAQHPATVCELAHHFYLARELGVADRAVRYCMLAGEHAAQSLAYEESAAHYRRALKAFALDSDGDEACRCDILLAPGARAVAGRRGRRARYVLRGRRQRPRARRRRAPGRRRARPRRALLGGGGGRRAGAGAARGGAGRAARARQPQARAADGADGREPPLHRRQGARHAAEPRGRRDGAPARGSRHAQDGAHGPPRRAAAHRAPRRAPAPDRRGARADTGQPRADRRGAPLAPVRPLRGRRRRPRRSATTPSSRRSSKELRQPLLEHLALGWQGTFAHLAGDVEEAERLARESFEIAERAQVRQRARLATPRCCSRCAASRAASRSCCRRCGGSRTARPPRPRGARRSRSRRSRRARWRRAARATRRYADRRLRRRAARLVLVADDGAARRGVRGAARHERAAPSLYALLEPFADRFVQVIFTASWGSIQRHLGLLAGVMGRFDDAERHFEAALERQRAHGRRADDGRDAVRLRGDAAAPRRRGRRRARVEARRARRARRRAARPRRPAPARPRADRRRGSGALMYQERRPQLSGSSRPARALIDRRGEPCRKRSTSPQVPPAVV